MRKENNTILLAFDRAIFCGDAAKHDSVPIACNKSDIKSVSQELIRSNLDATLLSRFPSYALESLERSGLLYEFVPDICKIIGFGGKGHKDLWHHTKIVVEQTPPMISLRWAALFHDAGKPDCFSHANGKIEFHGHENRSKKIFRSFANRSGLFIRSELNEMSNLIIDLARVESYEKEWTDSAVRRMLREIKSEPSHLILLARADVTSKHKKNHDAVSSRMDSLEERIRSISFEDAKPKPLPKGLGNILIEKLSIEPGPELGKIMSSLKDLVEAESIPRSDDPSDFIEHARKLM